MKSALFKDYFREIKRTFSRFLSIMVIIGLGVGFFVGVKATGPDMRAMGEDYFRDTRLADFRLLSSYGWTEAELALLQENSELSGVMPGYSGDFFLEDSSTAVHVLSLPDLSTEDPDFLNRPVLVEGRMPQSADECLLDAQASEQYALGDTITFSGENTDLLVQTQYTVVGYANLPTYITIERGTSSIGNGKTTYFAMLQEQAFDSDVYTEVYVRLQASDTVSPFSEAYDTLIEEQEAQLLALLETRSPARLEEIKAQAQEEIDQARQDLEEAKQQLADAEKELSDGEAALADGEREYAQAQQDFAEQIQEAEQKLQDAWAQIQDGETAYQTATEELEQKQAELSEGLSQLEEGRTELQEQQAVLEETNQQLHTAREEYQKNLQQAEDKQAEITAAQALLDPLHAVLLDPSVLTEQQKEDLIAGVTAIDSLFAETLSAYLDGEDRAEEVRTYTDALAQQLEEGQTELDQAFELLAQTEQTLAGYEAEYQAGVEQAAAAEEQLANTESLLADASKQLEDGYAQLANTRSMLDTATAEYQQGRQELDTQRAEGEEQLADAAQELEDSRQELAEGRAEYEEQLPEAQQEIADGEEKLLQAEADISSLKPVSLYAFNRDSNPGYSGFEDDSNRIDNIAKIFPVFFFVVAALVCLTTMTRMVEEKRSDIATLKALGYGNGAIIAKFLIYAVTASLIGSIAGLAGGFKILPKIIFSAYQIMYLMPDITCAYIWSYAIGATLVAVACTALTASITCRAELTTQAAQLMRPKAPKPSKRILLEKIPFIWKHLSFIKKVTARNIFRYKQRMLMTVVGIAGCTALMLAGFGLKDSISDILLLQFDEVWHYDMTVMLDTEAEDADMDALQAVLDDPQYGVKDRLYTLQETIELEGKDKNLSVTLMVPENIDSLRNFIDLHTRQGKVPIDLTQEGVVLTEKAATLLDCAVGDTVAIQDSDHQTQDVQITGITENYAMHYIYMTPDQYEQIFGKPPAYNALLLQAEQPENIETLSHQLMEQASVLGLSDNADVRSSFMDTVESLNVIVFVLIVAAAMLAFVVLYNLSNVNVAERKRELSTIKVLGFFDREVSAYIGRETVVLTALGIVFGLAFGIVLHGFIIRTAEIDIIMFVRSIHPVSYLFSAALTAIFSGIVNFAVHFKLKKINMVEALKSVE